jgi:hypothetical protein
MERDYLKACRQSDAINYHLGQKSGNGRTVVEEARKTRSLLNKQDESKKKILEEFLERDFSELPGSVFFDEAIVKSYGVYPRFLSKKGRDTLEARREWLSVQEDSGEIYTRVHEDLIKSSTLKGLEKLREDSLKAIAPVLLDKLEEPERLKVEKDLSTGKFDFKKVITTENDNEPNLIVGNLFLHDLINHHNDICLKLESESKRIRDTNKTNLETLCQYLNGNSIFGVLREAKIDHQTGKYFTKWTCLSTEEKEERLESFAYWFVNRHLVIPELIDIEEASGIETELLEILVQNHKDKNIKYRDLRWNPKKGMIEDIKNLRYNRETKNFEVLATNLPKSTSLATPKRAVIRTNSLFEDKTERKINEHMLIYILGLPMEELLSGDSLVRVKQSFLKNTTSKLKLKRVDKNELATLALRFEEMYLAVYEHRDELDSLNL